MTGGQGRMKEFKLICCRNAIPMSYDLSFAKIKGQPLSSRDIISYLEAKIPATIPEQGLRSDFNYYNENTGVYFFLELDEADKVPVLMGFEHTGLSFNLSFMRPDFFGKEAFLFVKNLVADLNLFVLNPQGEEPDIPQKPNAQLLYEEWRVTNSKFAVNYFDEKCCYMSPEVTDFIWEYNLRRSLINEELGKEYFVPRVSYFRRAGSQEPIRVCAWAFPDPAVFPEVDYVVMGRLRKNWWGRERMELGVVKFDTLLEQAGGLLAGFKESGCRILPVQHAPAAMQALKGLEMDVTYKKWMEPLGMLHLQNYRP